MADLPQDHDFGSAQNKILRQMGRGGDQPWPQAAVGGQMPSSGQVTGGGMVQQQQMPPMMNFANQPMAGRQGYTPAARPMNMAAPGADNGGAISAPQQPPVGWDSANFQAGVSELQRLGRRQDDNRQLSGSPPIMGYGR
jgi:hypothetical protein